MARPEKSPGVDLDETVGLLHYEDDLDIKSEQYDDRIEESVSETKESMSTDDIRQQGIKEEFPELTQLVQRPGRAAGRTQRETLERTHVWKTTPAVDRAQPSPSQQEASLRETDEAQGWSFCAREVPADRPVFESKAGVRAPTDRNSSEYDYFKLFFTRNTWGLLKKETNRYASETKAKLTRKGELKKGSSLDNWTPVTEAELKKFFSVVIHMTLVKKGTIDSYWSTKSILNTPFASHVMKRDRFRAIYSCLRLNDSSKMTASESKNGNAFFEIKPYFDELCQSCETYYQPNENLTINEHSFTYKDRGNFRVFNKGKLDKSGMRIYMLCDSETGYVLRMIPHVGNSKTAERIVLELMQPYLGKWHTVYLNRFLTDPTIFDLLWTRETRAVGPVSLNGCCLPQEWRRQALEVDEMAFCHRGNITACKWKDKREVGFLTTKHAASWTKVGGKAKNNKTKRIKPDCLLDYNFNKNSVESNNQYVSNYCIQRKSMKWWKNMFFHLTARAMVNAYVLYSREKSNLRLKGFADFLASCGEALAEDGGHSKEDQPSAGPHSTGAVSRLHDRHFLERIPRSEKKEVRSRVCKVCADTIKRRTGKRGRKETIFYCPDCSVPLCYDPCFKKYHTLKDYTS